MLKVKDIPINEYPVAYQLINSFLEKIKGKKEDDLSIQQQGMLNVIENEMPKNLIEAYNQNFRLAVANENNFLGDFYFGKMLVLSWFN